MESIEKLRKYASNFGGPDWDEVGLIADALASVAADVKATRKMLEDNLRCYRRERMKCSYSMETEAVNRMVRFYSNAIDEIERIEKWLAWAMDDELEGDTE